MNKTEFITAVAEKSGLSKADAKKAVDAFVETVSDEMKAGGKIAHLSVLQHLLYSFIVGMLFYHIL